MLVVDPRRRVQTLVLKELNPREPNSNILNCQQLCIHALTTIKLQLDDVVWYLFIVLIEINFRCNVSSSRFVIFSDEYVAVAEAYNDRAFVHPVTDIFWSKTSHVSREILHMWTSVFRLTIIAFVGEYGIIEDPNTTDV